MRWIDHPSSVDTFPVAAPPYEPVTGGPRWFSSGNPTGGVQSTRVTRRWLNGLQASVRHLALAAGFDLLAPEAADPAEWDLVTKSVKNVSRFNLPATATKTANYSAVAADHGKLIPVDATSGAVTITLPASGTLATGFTLAVKKIDASANAVTIQRAGSDTLDGATSLVLGAQHDVGGVMFDSGTAFRVAWEKRPPPASIDLHARYQAMLANLRAQRALVATRFLNHDGLSDTFNDAGGIDAAASPNFTVTGGYATNRVGGPIPDNVGTILTGAEYTVVNQTQAFTGSTSKLAAACALGSESQSGFDYMGKSYSSARALASISVYSSSDAGWSSSFSTGVTFRVEAGNGSFSEVANLTVANNTDGPQKDINVTGLGPYTHWRLKIDLHSGGAQSQLAKITFNEALGSVTDGNLTSNAMTADDEPTLAQVLAIVEGSNITIGTDTRVFASKNNGSTWTEAVLDAAGFTAEGYILVTGTVAALAGSGTAMRVQVRTANGKEQKIHDVAMDWGI